MADSRACSGLFRVTFGNLYHSVMCVSGCVEWGMGRGEREGGNVGPGGKGVSPLYNFLTHRQHV